MQISKKSKCFKTLKPELAEEESAWMPNNRIVPPSLEVTFVLLILASMPSLKISIFLKVGNRIYSCFVTESWFIVFRLERSFDKLDVWTPPPHNRKVEGAETKGVHTQ
jgi:hypothetical protein